MFMKKFLSLNFGCRVNSAETNLWSQTLIDQGYLPDTTDPDIIFINTCAITKKGEYESVSAIKKLIVEHPKAFIIATGCADLSDLKSPRLKIISNPSKEKFLSTLNSLYTPKIKDKYSRTHRFLLKVQSGCTAFCTYCTVPVKRPYSISLPIDKAVNTVNSILINGYKEVIVTGVNLNLYSPGFSNLVEALLTQTSIPLITFGSIPLLCIDDKFISLLQKYPNRLSKFLHIPLQSGSDKILQLMNRPYNTQLIQTVFLRLAKVGDLTFGTDIIVGFPTESESDFKETLSLCKNLRFQKIHVFRFSPRPDTAAHNLFLKSPKIPKSEISHRSQIIRRLVVQSTK